MRRHRQGSSAGASRRTPKTPVLPPDASLRIERLAHDGRGIATVNGRITFVDQALPGETHRVRFVGGKTKFLEAVSVALESEPAVERAAPLCGHYQSCGGCQLQHLQYSAQVEFKQALVQDQCRRAGVDAGHFEAPVSAAQVAYRSRCRLSINHKGQAFAGFRQKSQTQLIKLQHCPILSPSLESLLESTQNALAELPADALGHLEMIDDTKGVVLILRHVKALDNSAIQRLQQFADEHQLTLLLQPAPESVYLDLQGLQTLPPLSFELPDLAAGVRYQPQHFTQVNRPLNQRMVAQALAWIEPQADQLWLDLFCGVGNFSLPLAQHVKLVVGVEGVPEMVVQASKNATIQGLNNCEFFAADLEVDSIYRKLPKGVHGVILDPPRAGAKAVVRHLLSVSPRQILYVSCDPATFARDAKVLLEGGYRVKRIGILDMFPQTMHVETMALLEQ